MRLMSFAALLISFSAYGDMCKIQEAARVASVKYGIQRELILAIIEVESQFNPNATGFLGEVGLMQLRPVFFPRANYDIDNNIDLGVNYLKFVKINCPQKKGMLWIACYNQGINRKVYSKKYYKKVMNALRNRWPASQTER